MAAEPWEGSYGASSGWSPCLFFGLNRLISVVKGWILWSDRCLCRIWGVLCRFGADFRCDFAVWAAECLSLFSLTGLRQPWRASIFSVLLASASLSLTANEDLTGLWALWIEAFFCNLLLNCLCLFCFFNKHRAVLCYRFFFKRNTANVNLVLHL